MHRSSAAFLSVLTMPLTGCLAAGYTSSGGWFVWPRSFGLLFILLILFLILRRR